MLVIQDIAEQLAFATCAEDALGDDPASVADRFKTLARVVHPDHYQKEPALLALATKAFQTLTQFKREADEKLAAGAYGDRKRPEPPKVTVIKVAGDRLELGPLLRSGDIADVYAATLLKKHRQVVVKIARSPKDNDLMRAERETLSKLDAIDPKGRRYFAEGTGIALDVNGRVGNVLQRYPEHVPLDRIRARSELGFRDMAWMLRRMLEGLGHLHRAGLVHGNVIPPNLLFHPIDHGLRLIDWCYAVPIGKPGKAKSADWSYPPELLKKQPLVPASDIYMVVSTARWMLKSDAHDPPTPPVLLRFLEGCMLESPSRRPQDAWALHEELGELLQRLVGPPRYHRLAIGAGESFT